MYVSLCRSPSLSYCMASTASASASSFPLQASIAAGVPAGAAAVAEADQYFYPAELLRRLGFILFYSILFYSVLSCVVLSCAVLSCVVLCCAVLSCVEMCCAVLSCVELCCAVLSRLVLLGAALHFTLFLILLLTLLSFIASHSHCEYIFRFMADIKNDTKESSVFFFFPFA